MNITDFRDLSMGDQFTVLAEVLSNIAETRVIENDFINAGANTAFAYSIPEWDEEEFNEFSRQLNVQGLSTEVDEKDNELILCVYPYRGLPSEIFDVINDQEIPDEEEEEDEEEMWVDPAGGTHYGNEEDPAAQYESVNENWEQCNEEVKMAKMQLKNILSNTNLLLSRIESCTELDAWVQSYLTKADDYLESVRKYAVYGEEEKTEVLQPIPVNTETPAPIQEPVMPPMKDFEPGEETEEEPEEPIEEPETIGEEPEDTEDLNVEKPSEEEIENDELSYDDLDFYNKEEEGKEGEEEEEMTNDQGDDDNKLVKEHLSLNF